MKNIIAVFLTVVALGVTSCGNAQKEAGKKEGVQHISVSEFKALDFEYQLVDVRTPDEYMSGAIEGSKNIDYFSADFLAGINKLDKEAPVVLYCRSGRRSAKAGENLIQAGFKEVYNVKGGYIEYAKAK